MKQQEVAAACEIPPVGVPTTAFEEPVTLPASAFEMTVPIPIAISSQAENTSRFATLFDWRLLLASAAVGLAMGWEFCGARTIFSAEIDPLPATTTMVGVVALLLVAGGMAIPERTMRAISSLARRVSNRSRTQGIHEPITGAPQQSDLCLSWLALGLVSAGAAFAGLLGVAVSWPVFGIYRKLLQAFFWTDVSLAGMEWTLAAVLLIVPCLAFGVLLVNLVIVAAAGRTKEHWSGAVQTGLFLGFAIALGLDAATGWRLSAEREVVFGTLPLFGLAASAVYISHREERKVAPAHDQDSGPPELSGGPDAFIRIAPLLWVCAVAITFVGWLGCRSALADERMLFAWLLAGTAVGYMLSSLMYRRFGPWLYSPGALLSCCGIAAGVAATTAAWSPDSGYGRSVGIFCLSLAAGHALHGHRRAALARAASRSLGLIHLGMVLFAGAAVGLAAARWWALPQLGAMGTLIVGSLLLLAMGGLLELHGEDQPSRSQQLRLAIVFGSLAIAIVMFPAYTRWWTRQDRERVASTSRPALAKEAFADLVAGVRTACLIGVDPAVLESLPQGRTTQVEVLPLSSWGVKPSRRKTEERVQAVLVPAPRALRLTRMRYQLLYQCLRPERDSTGLYCSAEWLGTLNEHLADGGMLIVDVPLSGLDRAAVVDIAGTFQHVSTSPSFWAVTAGSQPRLLLGTQPAVAQIDSVEGLRWSSVDALISPQGVSRIQSIRSGRVGPVHGAQFSTQRMLEWLTAQAGRFSPVARVATPRPLPR